jgi:Tfp pilus assembly protein PilF
MAVFLAGCALMAAQHQADAAFRRALGAQLAGDEARAEINYQEVLKLGVEDSPTLNNLGVIAVHRHNYVGARHLFGRAVQADARDVVALTNYGVLSYYLADLKEARRTLDGARQLRKHIMESIPSSGRSNFDEERWARITEPLDQVAAKYLQRVDEAVERGRAESLMAPGELFAALSMTSGKPLGTASGQATRLAPLASPIELPLKK